MPFNIEFIYKMNRPLRARTHPRTHSTHKRTIHGNINQRWRAREMNRLKIQNRTKQNQAAKNEAVNFTNQNECEYCVRVRVSYVWVCVR